jgi:hypothetical protein
LPKEIREQFHGRAPSGFRLPTSDLRPPTSAIKVDNGVSKYIKVYQGVSKWIKGGGPPSAAERETEIAVVVITGLTIHQSEPVKFPFAKNLSPMRLCACPGFFCVITLS